MNTLAISTDSLPPISKADTPSVSTFSLSDSFFSSHMNTETPVDEPQSITSLVVPFSIPDNHITDAYLVDALGKPIQKQISNLFLTVPQLHGPQGEKVQILAIVDNGAMINAIGTAAHQRIAQRLTLL
jgi:hypothetical protein